MDKIKTFYDFFICKTDVTQKLIWNASNTFLNIIWYGLEWMKHILVATVKIISKLKIHDIVYVAETSGGIYAKGEVIESFSVDVFSKIEEVLDYSKQFKDDSYWWDKIRLFKDKLSSDPNYKLRCHQYFINQNL